MDFLTVLESRGQSFRHELTGIAVRIGRSADNDLVLPDPNVSRSHARIVPEGRGYCVLDNGSRNRTLLNDRPVVEPTRLRAGDRLRIGSTLLVFDQTPSSPIEFGDLPLRDGPQTSILSMEELRSSAQEVVPSLDAVRQIDARRTLDTGRALDAVTGATSLPANASWPSQPGIKSPGEALRSTLDIILEADNDLIFNRPLSDIFESIMDLAHRAAPFERGVLMLLEEGELIPAVVRVPPHEAGQPFSISRAIRNRVLQNRESVVTSDALTDVRFQNQRSIGDHSIRSLMCVPLWDDTRVIGLIYVDSRHAANLFGEADLRILGHLAHVAAVKIEHARLYRSTLEAERIKRDLVTAADIQRLLLPSVAPPIPGYLAHGYTLPCLTVGGDYFDFIPLPGGRIGFCIGDVAGKGMPAALVMCSFQASFRALAELDLPIEETMCRLNRLLVARIPANRFITFFYAVLDPERHMLTYVNAGQTPPCLVRSDGTSVHIKNGGAMLGPFADVPYEAGSLRLEPGDVLACFSDGVTEARNTTDDMFDLPRVLESVHRSRDLSPPEIIGTILEELETYRSDEPQSDDITLLVLKRVD